jgi:predicted acetyltransferase
MLRNSLRAAKERGDAVSVLIPAEWPIYGRFGYAPATQVASYRFHPRRRGATPNVAASARVRHVEPAELRTAAPEVFAAARRRHAGQLDRRFPWWERALGLDGHRFVSDEARTWVLHEGSDGPDGLVSWRATRGWEITGGFAGIQVASLIAASDDAYRDLWAYLAGIDLVDEIELSERPVDEPIRWLLPDGRTLEQTAVVDFLWLRLLDVCAALSARRYAVPGELVLDVLDDDAGGYGAGRVQLSADGSEVRCAPSQRPADLRLSQRALAACYLGGHRLRQRSVLDDVDELTPGAVQRFDAMFATAVAPWNQTWF